MTLQEFAGKYQDKNTKIKELTKSFNELGIKQRKDFLNSLPEEARKKFIDKIRNQAVKDFWYHERKAIMNGECTRDWTPEQIEEIMKISDSTGAMSTNANRAPVFDENGVLLVDKKGNTTYYGHHMVDVSTHPEFAGEWRNIQALDYDEHYDGAHPKHDTKTPTVGYYDVETGDTEVIDVDIKDFSFKKHVKYPPKRTCVFQSDDNMAKIYSNFDDLTVAEQLALKNVDLASRTGDVQRFNAGIDLAQRYNSSNFIDKVGLKTDAEIKQMYGVLDNCNDPDIINQYRLYEYSTRHGYQMDAVIYVDKAGNILGTSLDKTYIPDNNDFQLSMTESTKCLSEAELKSHSNLVKVEDAKAKAEAEKAEAAKESGESDKGTGEADKGTDAGRETGDSDSLTDTDKNGDGNNRTGDTPEYTNRNHLLDGSGSNDGTKVELSENSKKIISSYENASGQKVSTDFSTDMIKKVNKYADMLDFAGDALDLVDAGVSIYQAVNLFKSGDTNAGCKVLSDYGFSTLGGMGASALAAGIVGMCSLNPIVGFAFVFAAGFAGSELGKNFSDWWFEEVLGLYDDAGAYTYPVDPLILDLDGDGIETVSLEKGVNFDFDNNGFAEKTGWIGKDDGLLVRDINKNGQIDNGGELFGDLTTVDETVASNGFEALCSGQSFL